MAGFDQRADERIFRNYFCCAKNKKMSQEALLNNGRESSSHSEKFLILLKMMHLASFLRKSFIDPCVIDKRLLTYKT